MNREERQLLVEKYAGTAGEAFEKDCQRLALAEPLAYVIGWVPFLGLKVHLDSKPLIPRPETEWWVEELVAVMRKVWPSPSRKTEDFPEDSHQLRFLDLCSGSGAIGLTVLNQIPNAYVSFGEIVPEHVEQIKINITVNNLDGARVEVSDLFSMFSGEKFDIIASNPPYIPAGRTLDESVLKYEPATALFSGSDGLDIIRRIAEEVPRHLEPTGQLWLECDCKHAEAAKKLLEEGGARRVELRTDQYARPRLLVAYY